MLRDDIDTFDDEFFFLWKCAKNFCFNRSAFFDTIFIFLNVETIFSCDDTDDVSSVDFHSF